MDSTPSASSSPSAAPPTAPPTAPRKPEPQECCGTGCIPCVMDIYEEELWDYERAMKLWHLQQTTKAVTDDPV